MWVFLYHSPNTTWRLPWCLLCDVMGPTWVQQHFWEPIRRRPVASQPGGGSLNLDGWNTRRTTPPWTLSAWRHQFEKRPHSWTFTGTPPWKLSAWRHPPSEQLETTPLLDIHKHPPPLGHCPCDVIHIFQRWNKIAKGWNKIFGMGNWGGGGGLTNQQLRNLLVG